VMERRVTVGPRPNIPWPLVALGWLVAEVCLGAVLAALGVPLSGGALLAGGTAIWLSLCAFAPRAYLEAPEMAAVIGTRRAWLARLACGAGAALFWFLTVWSCRQ
jgi:hypothetical protein